MAKIAVFDTIRYQLKYDFFKKALTDQIKYGNISLLHNAVMWEVDYAAG